MTREALTLRVDATLAEAKAVFARSQAEVIPVVARDRAGWMRRYVGVVTRADLVKRLLHGPRSAMPLKRSIAELVREAPVLAEESAIQPAVERLLASGLSALPVLDADGGVRGVLSLGDVLARPLPPRVRRARV